MGIRTRNRALDVARALSCTAVVALAGLHPSLTRVARAADPRIQQELESAEQALVNLDYDNANKTATRVSQQRGLSHEQLVRVYRVLALTDAVLDKENAAREAFQQLLTYDPSYAGDANLGPKVQAPFMEARGFLRAQAVQPGIEVSVLVRAAEPGAIRVTTRDPLHIAKRGTVGFRWGNDSQFTLQQISVSEAASASVPAPPTGTTRLDYFVQIFDDHDDAVFESGSPASPKSTMVELAPVGPAAAPAAEHHSVFASPVFWTITGVVLAGAATGVYFATRKATDVTLPPTATTLSPSLFCGGTADGKCH
jgi:hypothetical protein